MGKIVKYCATCEESFSEKFSFCPNCASELTAFEMNPLVSDIKTTEPIKKIFEPTPDEVTQEPYYSAPLTTELPKINEAFSSQWTEPVIEPERPAYLANNTEDILEIHDEKVEEPIVTAPAIVIPTVAASTPEIPQTYNPTPVYEQTTASFADEKRPINQKLDDDGFYSVTLVEDKGSSIRSLLLMAASVLVLGGALLGFVASIYNYDAYIGALDDDFGNVVFVPNDEPADIEPEMPEPKNTDKGGGGGGGGQKDKTDTSKGVLASQSEKPQIPPSAKMDKVTNPELVLRPETQGNRKEKPSNDPYGDPNSKYNVASDGGGSGGGQGNGTGRGQGNGRGTGAGNGDGSGNGNGIGRGNGNGTGNGDNGRDDNPPPPPTPKPKPPEPVGPTVAIQITSKPRANYTDAARQAQVQGTVTLRVTFNANGTIGGIAPVSGLPNGLTEQAIAAARGIRFEPAKKNGVPYTVTKQVAYSFTLY